MSHPTNPLFIIYIFVIIVTGLYTIYYNQLNFFVYLKPLVKVNDLTKVGSNCNYGSPGRGIPELSQITY